MIKSGMIVFLVNGSPVMVGPMIGRTDLANCPVFECSSVDGTEIVAMYDMCTEQGEAYREAAKRTLSGHHRLLSDIGCPSVTRECVGEIKPNLRYVSGAITHQIFNPNDEVVGHGTDEQSAWLSALDNIIK